MHVGEVGSARRVVMHPELLVSFPKRGERLIPRLQEAWGIVTAGNEPWRGVRHRQVTENTAMCFRREGRRSLVITLINDHRWSLTEWDNVPPEMLESSLKGKVPFESLFQVEGMTWSGGPMLADNPADASRIYVKWCAGREQRLEEREMERLEVLESLGDL